MNRSTSSSSMPFNLNGNPTPSSSVQNMFFGSPNFTMSPQGKFVQRLCQVETENKILRKELETLKKWKTALSSWLTDAFGPILTDLNGEGDDDAESVGTNDSRDTNPRPTDELPENVSFGVVKLEVEEETNETTGGDVNGDNDSMDLNSTQPIIQKFPHLPHLEIHSFPESRQHRNGSESGQNNAPIVDQHNTTKESPESILQPNQQHLPQNMTNISRSSSSLSKTVSLSSGGNSSEAVAPKSPNPSSTGQSSGQGTLSQPRPLPQQLVYKRKASSMPNLPPTHRHRKEGKRLSKDKVCHKAHHRRIGGKKVDKSQVKSANRKVVTVTIEGDETDCNSNRNGAESPAEFDPTPCDVCRGSVPEAQNMMVYCEQCNICVHQACYGIPEIPEGEWLCQPCAAKVPVAEQVCRFCTTKGGAMVRVKSPKNNSWGHVACCWWIPGIHIPNWGAECVITGTPNIEKGRYNLTCSICKKGKGTTCCIQCCFRRCATAFHVTCAFNAGLRMEMVDDDEAADGVLLISYCNTHRETDLSTLTPTPRSPQKKKRKSNVPVITN